jgi:hypothetical protein
MIMVTVKVSEASKAVVGAIAAEAVEVCREVEAEAAGGSSSVLPLREDMMG